MRHYCYIVAAAKFVKIGYTACLEKRLEAIETHCPYKTSILCLFVYQTEEAAREMETDLHHRMRRHRVKGEWFHRKQVVKYLQLSGKLLRDLGATCG